MAETIALRRSGARAVDRCFTRRQEYGGLPEARRVDRSLSHARGLMQLASAAQSARQELATLAGKPESALADSRHHPTNPKFSGQDHHGLQRPHRTLAL